MCAGIRERCKYSCRHWIDVEVCSAPCQEQVVDLKPAFDFTFVLARSSDRLIKPYSIFYAVSSGGGLINLPDVVTCIRLN